MSLVIPESVRKRLAPTVAQLEPYDPHFTPVEINLSANENSYGLPAVVAAKVADALVFAPTNRYPSALADDLRSALAVRHGVVPERVIVGNGGDELIFNLFLAFGGAGRVLVNCPPTFTVYRTYAELLGLTVVDVDRDESFAVRTEELLEAAHSHSAALTVITSPNNPTGTVMGIDEIDTICGATDGLVLIDQAYIEFANPGYEATALLDAHPNLVILRTFSKAYALAGLRVGYVLASEGVIAALAAVRQPYSVNVLAQAAASTVIACADACASTIARIVAEREALRMRLNDLAHRGLTVFPSEANFLLVRVPEAHRVWERLRDEHSVLVRDFSSAPGLEGCLRVTVGTSRENERLIAGLEAVLG